MHRRRHLAWYILGAIPPVLLLCQYQWASFGHPLFPAQHYMPAVSFIERLLGESGIDRR